MTARPVGVALFAAIAPSAAYAGSPTGGELVLVAFIAMQFAPFSSVRHWARGRPFFAQAGEHPPGWGDPASQPKALARKPLRKV